MRGRYLLAVSLAAGVLFFLVSVLYFGRAYPVTAESPPGVPSLIFPLKRCSGELMNKAAFTSTVTRGAQNTIIGIGTSRKEKRGIEVKF